MHIKNIGSAEDVHVQLVCCTEGPAAPRRLCEPQVVLRYIQVPGAGEIADSWLPAGEAGQLAVISPGWAMVSCLAWWPGRGGGCRGGGRVMAC